jgi:hypothetical protein
VFLVFVRAFNDFHSLSFGVSLLRINCITHFSKRWIRVTSMGSLLLLSVQTLNFRVTNWIWFEVWTVLRVIQISGVFITFANIFERLK